MEKYIKKGKKRSYRLDKISVDDFVQKGLGTKDDFYKLTGKRQPKIKEDVKAEPVKKGAGK